MTDENVSIALSNPKSPSNVGAIMRAAGCFQAQEVLYTGERFDRANKYCTDTNNMTEKIPLTKVEDLVQALSKDVSIVCIELAIDAVSLTEYEHPEQACYIFGPEDGTICQKIIDKADAVVYIPTQGCLNLAASVNIVLYDRLVKSSSKRNDNEIIEQSRDQNNRIKVKTSK